MSLVATLNITMTALKYISIIMITLLSACGAASSNNDNGDSTSSVTSSQEITKFDADSAFAFVKAQTDFGPRVPGTNAHAECADYLAETFRRLGADTVIVQRAEVTAYNGKQLPAVNIMGRFNPDATERVLLIAHWDSRHVADRDSDPARRHSPIDGANDGASGVGVILEIARQASHNGIRTGLDLLLVDVEDYGTPEWENDVEDSWCLGTQHWVTDMPYSRTDLPRYAILLDMVGGRNAIFHREQISDAYARSVVDHVWATAASLGMSDRFVNAPGGAIIDDHLYINRAGIPCIDIIESYNPATRGFNPTWHTHDDNINNIDRSTLKAVGDVISRLVIQ